MNETPAAFPSGARNLAANPFVKSSSGSMDGNGTMTLEDLDGHRIELKAPSPLAPFRLVAAIGERARNQHYVAMLTPLLAVTAVDGVETEPLDSMDRIESLILRLGNAGVQAVSHAMLSELQRLMADPDPAPAA